MITNLYTIYDEIVQTYTQPFPAVNDNDAVRMVRLTAATPGNTLYDNAKDYTLYFCGTFNNEECIFENIEPKILVARVTSIINTIPSKSRHEESNHE